MLPAPSLRACVERGGDGLRCVQRRHLVGRGLAEEDGYAIIGVRLVRGETAVRLDDGVVCAAVAVRTLGTESRQRDVHDVGVDRRDVLVAEPDLVHHARAIVLQEHIGLRGEAADNVDAVRGVEIHRDRALSSIAHEVQRAHAVDGDADPPTDVADPGAFDLDHVGALIGEQRRGVRAGQGDRQVDDPYARHRTAHSANPACVRGRPSGPVYARPQRGGTAKSGTSTDARAESHESISASSAA